MDGGRARPRHPPACKGGDARVGTRIDGAGGGSRSAGVAPVRTVTGDKRIIGKDVLAMLPTTAGFEAHGLGPRCR